MRRAIILDTDLNEDCDDAGALAVLHALADQGRAEILGLSYCTSSVWGPPAIDIIDNWYGRPGIPIGITPRKGFLDEFAHLSYARYLCQAWPTAFRPQNAPGALALLRTLLAARDRRDVTLVAIGPLGNLAELLASGPDALSPRSGAELIKASVERLVLMGGAIPMGREYNLLNDPPAAKAVLAHWPTRIDIIDGKLGGSVWTGCGLQVAVPVGSPVRAAYYLHSGPLGNASYDLLAVDWAVTRSRTHYALSRPGRLEVDEVGNSAWVEDRKGRCRYLMARSGLSRLEARIEGLLCRSPAHPGPLVELDEAGLLEARKADLARHFQSVIDDSLEELDSPD